MTRDEQGLARRVAMALDKADSTLPERVRHGLAKACDAALERRPRPVWTLRWAIPAAGLAAAAAAVVLVASLAWQPARMVTPQAVEPSRASVAETLDILDMLDDEEALDLAEDEGFLLWLAEGVGHEG